MASNFLKMPTPQTVREVHEDANPSRYIMRRESTDENEFTMGPCSTFPSPFHVLITRYAPDDDAPEERLLEM